MSEEILFKAKRKDNGEWVEGYIVHIKGTELYYIFTGQLDLKNIQPSFSRYEVKKDTICRFSGVHDSYGKKIWEYDKCCITRPCAWTYGVVKFLEGCFCIVEDNTGSILRLCDYQKNNYDIRVKGNIYD